MEPQFDEMVSWDADNIDADLYGLPALLAEAAQGKKHARDGVMGVYEPPGMASPKSVHGCVGVVFCIRASVMISMKTHPKKRRARMKCAQDCEQPPDRSGRLEGLVG